MLTAYAMSQDSINFSLAETRVLLMHHVNYLNLQKVVDSCDIQERAFIQGIKNDSIIKYDFVNLLKTKDLTLYATEMQVKESKILLNKSIFWEKIWLSGTGFFGFVSLIEAGIIYLTLK